MQDNQQSILNNIEYKETTEYKKCAGHGCIEKGKNQLKIRYIKKCGWFCDKCTNELKNRDLILTENL